MLRSSTTNQKGDAKVNDEKLNPDKTEEDDVEGHGILSTQDYYRQVGHDRQAEFEREARQREREKEAEEANKNRR